MMATCETQGMTFGGPAGSPPSSGAVCDLYTASVVESFEAFNALQSEWESLFDAAGEVSINLDFGWLNAWLRNFASGRLSVITVRNKAGQLVGAAPFKISRPRSGLGRRALRHLQFIGTEPCLYDEMKILIHPEADRESVLREMAHQMLRHRGKWDVIDLRHCSDATQLQTLMALLKPAAVGGNIRKSVASPFCRLPDRLEDYAKKQAKNRRKLRHYENRLKRDFPGATLTLRQFEDSREIAAHLDRMAARHIEYWAERGVASNFARYPRMTAFYRELLDAYPASGKNGRVCVHFSALMLDDEVMSYDIGLGQRNGYLSQMPCYMEKFNRYSPGFTLFEKIIDQIILRGETHFYLGRGEEDYKNQWCDEAMALHNLLLFGSRFASVVWRGDETLKKLLGRS